jgi:hypothetical protein
VSEQAEEFFEGKRPPFKGFPSFCRHLAHAPQWVAVDPSLSFQPVRERFGVCDIFVERFRGKLGLSREPFFDAIRGYVAKLSKA